MDILGINFFLMMGVLLGAIRDKDFIKWDWDVELADFPEEIYPKLDKLEVLVKNKGFEVEKVRIESKYFKTNLRKYDNKYTTITGNKQIKINKIFHLLSNHFKIPKQKMIFLICSNFLSYEPSLLK